MLYLIFLVLVRWNNSLQIDMLLHSDTLSWYLSKPLKANLFTRFYISKTHELINRETKNMFKLVQDHAKILHSETIYQCFLQSKVIWINRQMNRQGWTVTFCYHNLNPVYKYEHNFSFNCASFLQQIPLIKFS